MENKDIEKLLQESADEVKVKDFSERWENIKDRICSPQEVELKETASETVLATSANSNFSQNPVKKKIIISVCAVFLLAAICLAIILPITLKKNDTPKFLNLNELSHEIVSEDEFYEQIEATDLKIVDIRKFEVTSYVLYYTDSNDVVGGSIDVTDEDEGVFAAVVFYGTSVKSSFETGTDFKSCTINGFDIEYKTELDEDELYFTKAQAVSDSINYEFECLSIDENIENFFNKLLG